jgi:hypothetical protein
MLVDDYIREQLSPQKEILYNLRKLILKTIPGINEEMKMGVPWYECKFYLAPFKDSVNMGFAYSTALEKFKNMLRGEGKYMRHIKFYSVSDIDEGKLTELIRITNKNFRNPHPKMNQKIRRNP